MAGFAGSVTVVCLLSVAGPAFAGLQNPPYGWTFTFDQAKLIGANIPVTAESGLANAPVRDARGSIIAHFVRIEIQDDVMPMGIITIEDVNRTVAVPLDRFRFDPTRQEVLIDMSWHEVNMLPSGRRAKGSPWYAFGRPLA
jgi:hypothetical protein